MKRQNCLTGMSPGTVPPLFTQNDAIYGLFQVLGWGIGCTSNQDVELLQSIQ